MAFSPTSCPLVNKSGAKVEASALAGKVVALYFSAHWCPPCRGFTPALKKFYETLKASGEPIEIVFVSGDRNESEMNDYFQNEHGDWLAVQYGAKECDELNRHYDVKGIPSLVVLNSKGESVVPDARADVGRGPSVFAQWKKVAGDWRESAGTALGGGSAASDAASMRAARLAALERRMGGGGGGPPPAAAPAPASAPAPAAPAASAPPVAASPEAEAYPELVKQLSDMGFPADQARQALINTKGDLEQAIALLC